MNTVQFFQSIINWLLADPSHIVVLASVVAAITPTPDPTTPGGKAYRIIDLLAVNFLHAKSSGITAEQALVQVTTLLAAAQKTKTVQIPPAA